MTKIYNNSFYKISPLAAGDTLSKGPIIRFNFTTMVELLVV